MKTTEYEIDGIGVEKVLNEALELKILYSSKGGTLLSFNVVGVDNITSTF